MSESCLLSGRKKVTLFFQLRENEPSKFFFLGWNSCDELWDASSIDVLEG
jgi:hypothetical protein